jgi:PKD repeat protein
VTAHFTDPGTRDTHAAQIDWGDGASSAATIASGSAEGSHAYTAAGVYTVSIVVTDDDGGSDTRTSAAELTAYVVVYDPAAGFVTGGGWITSPAGAYVGDPALTGRASFGFVARYHKGASTPSGNTEFEFKAGDLKFKATSYEWLVVAGSKAKYKGQGTINGTGQYGFMLTAIDGDSSAGSGTDAYRIKIWNLENGSIVYDNEIGQPDDSEPSTALGGGSIVVHR